MNFTYIVSIISLLFCILFFFYFRSFIKRRTAAEEILGEYRTEVYRLIAEIDIAADRDSRLVEERITTLKTLLADTDKRIAVYVRELERSRSGEALYTSLGRGIRAALGSQPAPQPAALQQQTPAAASAVTEPAPQAVTAAEAPAAASPAEPAAAGTAAVPAEKKQPMEQITELAGQGLSPAEIASRLNISISEVDLALNLHNLKMKKQRHP